MRRKAGAAALLRRQPGLTAASRAPFAIYGVAYTTCGGTCSATPRCRALLPASSAEGSPFHRTMQMDSVPPAPSGAKAGAVVSVTASPHSGHAPTAPTNEKQQPQKHATSAMIDPSRARGLTAVRPDGGAVAMRLHRYGGVRGPSDTARGDLVGPAVLAGFGRRFYAPATACLPVSVVLTALTALPRASRARPLTNQAVPNARNATVSA